MPGAGHFSDVEVDLTDIAGGATSITAVLTWKSDGTLHCAGPSDASTFFLTLADATKGGIALRLDKHFRIPTGVTTEGNVYLWLKVNAGTAKCNAARLNWNDGWNK
jgi:hypothetical protein